MKHYSLSFILLALASVWAFFYGGVSALVIVLILCALEISVSFDNAVVNAKILESMEPKWQQRFITWGIPIAVFGMRLVFPILIVAVASGISMYQAANLALTDVNQYRHILESHEHTIFAFGGSFLLMVFLSFFFDPEREIHWITKLESNKVVNKLKDIETTSFVIASLLGIYLISLTGSTSIAIAYFSGLILFAILHSLDSLFESDAGVKSGLAGFLYLEVLDASFSFDGVIGAFAISSDIFIIMVGLGIGAMFVRSITIHLLKVGALATFRFLEHGAHYAIGALALIMFIKMFTHISEVLVGGIGIAFIVVAVGHSMYLNYHEAGDDYASHD